MKRTTNWEDGTTSFKNNNHVTFDLHFYIILKVNLISWKIAHLIEKNQNVPNNMDVKC